MNLRKGSKVKFIQGTRVKKRGHIVPIDYDKAYKVVSVNWGRVGIIVDEIGAVYVYNYQLTKAA